MMAKNKIVSTKKFIKYLKYIIWSTTKIKYTNNSDIFDIMHKLNNNEIEIDNEIIRFSIISWSEETQINFLDLKYIRDVISNSNFTLISRIREWERNNFAIDHIIQIKHGIKFEKEEWEE